MKRRDLERFLLAQGFTLKPGGMTSHKLYIRNGAIVTLTGHGPQDVSKKMRGILIRQLEAAGISREEIKKEFPR